jgi:hypothetical protein
MDPELEISDPGPDQDLYNKNTKIISKITVLVYNTGRIGPGARSTSITI